ncbi:mfs drug [Moniliophthora roreri MCA 2997]|uniref:Mfs drug n=1 Tax=Moniliophthora roreri (strain MCA 2997) TaxID=1381753 RepID=V2X634_MONRO|nr:mfs drug [Moniliophthora roreri MCA 2997]
MSTDITHNGIETLTRAPSEAQIELDRHQNHDNDKVNTCSDVESSSFPKFDDMSPMQIAAILLSLGLAMFLFAIEETIVATSVSSIGAALDIKGSLAWISTSYLLTTTVVQPILGRIADVVGVKRFLMIELWIFVIGNIIAGTANTLAQIIAGRLIAGIGGAGLLTLSCIVISQLTHERQRASYMNLINIVFIVSDSLGPVLGGVLGKSGNWRWIFLLNAPFGPVITVVLWRALNLARTRSDIRSFRDVITKVDIMGMCLLVACLSFLIVTLNTGGQTIPWDSPMIIGMLCASGVAFVAFWLAEKYAKMPVAPTRLFVKWEWRNVPIAFVTRTLLFFHIFANTFYLPVFLQVIGRPTLLASALVIPFLIIAAIASTAVNELCRIYGHVRLFFIGGLLILPIGLGLMSSLNETSSVGRIVGYSLIAGAGFGSGTQISMVIAQVGLPEDELSTVTALVGSAPNLGGTLGVAAIGAVINNVFRDAISSNTAILDTRIPVNANDAVYTVNLFPAGTAARTAVVKAYVGAWQRGYWTLVGISGLEILLCLFLRKVELQGRETSERKLEKDGKNEANVQNEKSVV